MDPRTHAAITWLLNSGEPAIRLMTRRDLLGEQADEDAGQVPAGAKVTALLSGQQPDGGFGVHPYRKWTGAHWRLVSLVELAVLAREPRAAATAGHVLAWLASPGRRVPRIGGLARTHASIEGNALAACCRLGLAADPRVRSLAASLIAWQWPDGGWNCDPAATGRRSSFHESLAPAWGLHEYGQATGDPTATDAASRAAGLFLDHRLFRSQATGQLIHPSLLEMFSNGVEFGLFQAWECASIPTGKTPSISDRGDPYLFLSPRRSLTARLNASSIPSASRVSRMLKAAATPPAIIRASPLNSFG